MAGSCGTRGGRRKSRSNRKGTRNTKKNRSRGRRLLYGGAKCGLYNCKGGMMHFFNKGSKTCAKCGCSKSS